MENRLENILTILEREHSLSYKRLAELCFVSQPTARRDAAKLIQLGYAKRTYGGITFAKYKNEVIPVDMRDSTNSVLKDKIARTAAELVKDGDTLFLDSSSTVRRICGYLSSKKDITVITNNLRVLNDLRNTDVNVFCTGGVYYKQRDCFLGALANKFIENVNADIMFFSALGLSADGIISDVSEEEIAIRKTMYEHSSKHIFLCDHTKYGVIKPLKMFDISQADMIISDKDLGFDKK